jgi:hypothetical protein
MARPLSWLLGAAILAVPPAGAWANDVAELTHNPFSRPEWFSARGPGTGEARREDKLELRATLTASEHPMADISGVILAVGDEVDGLRLVEVDERRAVLERDGTKVVVILGDEE